MTPRTTAYNHLSPRLVELNNLDVLTAFTLTHQTQTEEGRCEQHAEFPHRSLCEHVGYSLSRRGLAAFKDGCDDVETRGVGMPETSC